jgi:hypothetical protein
MRAIRKYHFRGFTSVHQDPDIVSFVLGLRYFEKYVSSLFNCHLNRRFTSELKYELKFVRKQNLLIQEYKLVRNFMEQSHLGS